MDINTDHKSQSLSVLDQAKRLIRCERQCLVEKEKHAQSVPIASALDGSILVQSKDEMALIKGMSVTATIGTASSLKLVCTVEALSSEDAPFYAARYQMHHGETDHDTLVRLVLESATLTDGDNHHDIPVDELLTQTGPELMQLERRAVDHMNDDHLDAVSLYAEVLLTQPAGDWRIATLDMDGLDLTEGNRFVRLWFDPPLTKPDEIKSRLIELVHKARASA